MRADHRRPSCPSATPGSGLDVDVGLDQLLQLVPHVLVVGLPGASANLKPIASRTAVPLIAVVERDADRCLRPGHRDLQPSIESVTSMTVPVAFTGKT